MRFSTQTIRVGTISDLGEFWVLFLPIHSEGPFSSLNIFSQMDILTHSKVNNQRESSIDLNILSLFCYPLLSIVSPSHLSSPAAAAAAKLRQSCPTLCNPIDGSPTGSPIPGILQARTLEWVAISFSNAWKGKVKVKSLSRVWLFTTPWTAAHQAPPSMEFSRQEYWSGVPLPKWSYIT